MTEMTLDFRKYQEQALTTALPSALTMDYLAPGLIAELGEVFGKQAKAVRDGWDTERLNREVCAELGDCCWFIALIVHVQGVEVFTDRPLAFTTTSLREGMRGAMVTRPLPAEREGQRLSHLIAVIAAQAATHGSTLEAVAQANLDKLADRQARNVIAGSGDTR